MMKNKRRPNIEREFNQQLIHLARVTRVMKGGKRMRFRATVAIGDGKGRVGYGVSKGADVTIAINKAVRKAKKNLINVPLVNNTIPHEIRVKYKSAKVMLKPAPQGTGIRAGSVVRQVLELAGVPNVIGKILGTRSKLINVQAVMLALSSFKTKGLKLDKKKKEVPKKKPFKKEIKRQPAPKQAKKPQKDKKESKK